MLKEIFLCCLLITCSFQPVFAKSQTLKINSNLTFNSKNYLGVQNNLRSSNNGILRFDINYNLNNLSSKLSLSYDTHNKFITGGSYLQYTSGIATYGLGTVERHWSFSDKTSLILSHNARPAKSIYLKLKDTFDSNWLPSGANWTFDVFNGYTEGSLNDTKSMLLGIRAVISPTQRLNFEFLQTSQWGGKGYNSGLSALGAALAFDTNIGSNENINKMAGFGISYLTNYDFLPLRIYGQAIGEDEAGNLPSCFAYLAGLEWAITKVKYPTTFIIEAVDTRIKRTTNGFCGSNTFYNNATYDYTNYGVTLGAAIDTEGSSIELFGRTQLSQILNIEYSTKLAIINDKNWSVHRLSSKRQSGLISSLGISWVKKSLKFNGNVYYQDFILDKANVREGLGIGISSSILF